VAPAWVDQEVRAEVGGQDEQGVPEVDRCDPDQSVRPTVVEHLQEDVEDLGDEPSRPQSRSTTE
jgi:hypothetical protein